MAPTKTTEPEPDDWDIHWDRYAAAATRNPAQQMRHRYVVRLLARTGGTAPMRLLDIGSGQGDLLRRIRQHDPAAALAGFELSEQGVAISRKKVPSAAFVVADLFRPPPELGEYRGWATHASCSEVLEHVDSPVDFLRAARPCLAPGAQLIVTVPGGPMSAFDRHIGHRTHFTRESISRVLEQGGFRVERVYLAGFPFFNLYRGVVIARGKRLATDISRDEHGFSAGLARCVMGVFRLLFRLNLMDSPFGWQVVAVARNAGGDQAASEPIS